MQNNDIVNKQSMGSILHHQCEEHHSLKQPKTKLFIIFTLFISLTFFCLPATYFPHTILITAICSLQRKSVGSCP